MQEEKDNLIPLFTNKVSCGLFGVAENHIEDYQSLDKRFVKNPHSSFFFKAVGDSMEPLILENDTLLVDRSIEDYYNRVCILVYNGDLICKRLIKKQNHLCLRSENNNIRDIIIKPGTHIEVWGVVRSIIRDTL